MFCAVALFVIFTSNTEQARRRNVNARDNRKIFKPSGLQRIWIRSNCTPKSLKNFRVKAGAMPLQNDACAIFAKEKSEEQQRITQNMSDKGNLLWHKNTVYRSSHYSMLSSVDRLKGNLRSVSRNEG